MLEERRSQHVPRAPRPPKRVLEESNEEQGAAGLPGLAHTSVQSLQGDGPTAVRRRVESALSEYEQVRRMAAQLVMPTAPALAAPPVGPAPPPETLPETAPVLPIEGPPPPLSIRHLLRTCHPGVQLRDIRATLSLLLAGSGLTANGVRAAHVPALNSILIMPDLQDRGLTISYPTTIVIKATVLWMAEPLGPLTLQKLRLDAVRELREDPLACDNFRELFFMRGRNGTTGYYPNLTLEMLAKHSGRAWPGTRMSLHAKQYILDHFEQPTGKAKN